MSKLLPEIIVGARHKLDLTKAQVAQKVGISASDYSSIEGGETYPQFTILKKIAEILEIDLDEIVSD